MHIELLLFTLSKKNRDILSKKPKRLTRIAHIRLKIEF